MAVPFQPVKYRIFGGLDTKIDGVALTDPKLLLVQNAHSAKTGSLQRRYGRTAITSTDTSAVAITGWKALATYKGNLVGFTGPSATQAEKVYEKSSLGWVDHGTLFSARVTSQQLLATTDGIWFADSATSSAGVTVYVSNTVSGAASIIRADIVDATGVALRTAYEITASGWAPRVVVHGLIHYVVYWDIVASTIKCKRIDTSTAALLVTSLATAATTVASDADTVLTGTYFDIVDNSAYGVFIAYRTTTVAPGSIKFGFINTSGALVTTSTIATAAVTTGVAVAVSPGLTQHAVCYMTAVNNGVYASHHAFDSAAWTMTVTSGQLDTTSVAVPSVLAAKYEPSSNTTVRVYWSGDAATTTSTGFNDKFIQATYTTTGVSSVRISVLRHSRIASKAFVGPDNGNYIVVLTSGTTADPQRAYYVIRCSDNAVAACLTKDFAINVPVFNHLPQVVALSASKWAFPGGYSIDVDNGGGFGFKAYAVEWAHAASHKTIEVGESLYIAGSIPMQYDGISAVESGFMRYVYTADVVATPSNGTGSIAGAAAPGLSYSYRVIPEWTNARGELDRGTDTGAITVAVISPNDTVTLSIPTIAHTFKQGTRDDLVFAIYRTEDTPDSDSPFYRVGSVANDPAADEVTYVDGASDGTITDEITLDVESLENIGPPPSYILAQSSGRQFLAGIPGLPHTIWASKTRLPNEPVLWSDALTIDCPEAGGAIVAMEAMGETLVIFKESRIYRMRADVGPNNTGTVGSFLVPELVSADTGCEGQRSVVVCPMGLMFEGVKGIMLLDQSFQVKYIGAPVENTTAIGVINGACCLPSAQQVRFSGTSRTHVYDYFHSQWYVFTHGSVGPTVEWNDEHTAIHSANVVAYDDPATFYDTGTTVYAMTITLGWLALPETLQGDMRVQRVGLTGTQLGANLSMTVTLYKNFNEVSGFQTVEVTSASTGVFMQQYRTSQQVMSSLQVSITDAVGLTATTTAGLRLSEVVFHVGVRGTGLART